ncbi:MAG: TolC family protein, partial [Cyclobacteriaceae bacterium]|nr:TolC family protein [Cyclobacteriaceae bacterium]
AIVIGLQEKLSLKKSILAIDKAEENVKQAKGNLTPSLSADVQTKWLSDNLVEAFLGREGSTTITGSLNLQQVIFSEPVLTNVAINKLVQENTTEQNRQTILDDVVTIAQTYISVLLAKTNLTLQNENLNVTKANLSVAENKDKLGLSKQSDVNRWISELNMNKIQLSNALANYKKAVYTLNETLNQDISIEYNFPESIDIDEALNFPEELIIPFIKDEYLTEILADFYLKEMQSYSPELMRVLISEQIIDRQIKSNKRQYVLPDVVGFANASDVFLREGNYTDPNLPVPPLPNDLTWNAGIGLSLPIFDRRTRSTNLQKSIIDKEIIQYSKQEIENALERNIRTQVHQFKASYVSNDFALKASEAADKNFSQVEDAYKQGFITVTQLLEAQSSKFNANLLAVQTNYKVVLDYLILERLTGKIQLLDTETQQKEYLIRLQQHLITRE